MGKKPDRFVGVMPGSRAVNNDPSPLGLLRCSRRVIRERVRLRWEDAGAGLLMSDLAVGYAQRRLANTTRTLCESTS